MCSALMPSIMLLIFIAPICATLAGSFANKYHLDKQIFLLEILHHVQEPLLNRKLLLMGRQLVLDESEYVHYNAHMREFHATYLAGDLLSRDVFYRPHLTLHYRQTVGLYNFFYNTREWATLCTNICWARQHVNAGMFVYALSQALLKRPDYRLLRLPRIYELWPEHFQQQRTVRQARNFNYSNWVRQMAAATSSSMSWQEQVHETWPKTVLPPTLDSARNSSDWSAAMSNVRVFWLPAAYGRGQLSHLIEDVDWNAYWYYLNMAVALSDPQHADDRLRLCEWWYAQLAQLVARYKLERYSRGLTYAELEYEQRQQRPQVLTWTNDRLGVESKALTACIEGYLRHLAAVVATANTERSYALRNGTTGRNWQSLLTEIFKYDLNEWKTDWDFADQPQGLLELTTALRMPNFYYYADRLLQLYRSFRSGQQPAHSSPAAPFDVQLHTLHVSRLCTYAELVDSDLTNLLHNRHFYYFGNFLWPHALQARQARLTSAPFTLHLNISTAQWQSVTVRVFLTTAAPGAVAVQPYYQLDTFRADLRPGCNLVERRSSHFFGYADDQLGYTELYQYAQLAMKDAYRFPLNLTTPACGFPRRLLLPRGTPQGLGMRLLVVATPATHQLRAGHELDCYFSDGISSFDALPSGYPFDREVSASELLGKHMLWQNVRIYHEE